MNFNSNSNSNESQSKSIGPQLPPNLIEKSDDEGYYGPQLPPNLQNKAGRQVSSKSDSESDEEVCGPMPLNSGTRTKAQIALEERALELKIKNLEPETVKEPIREEWMLELPQVRAANFGLGARQFRKKETPDMSNRSSWTDTPKDKIKRGKEVDLKNEELSKEVNRRDKEQEKIAKSLKRKNKESLLELHQSKMKEKKKEQGPSERRPFNREVDLQVNRFDEAQKKAVLKKAQLLDDRFSSGHSKFL